MSDINYNQIERAAVEIMTLHQAAIMKFGVGVIAYERKKSDKTVYAELNPANLMTYIETIRKYDDGYKKPGCLPKLGLIDFIIDMTLTGDLSPLIKLAAFFNMTCFEIPKQIAGKEGVLELLQKFNQEYNESINDNLEAIKDNKITSEEAEKNSADLTDVINVASTMKSFYDNILNLKTKR